MFLRLARWLTDIRTPRDAALGRRGECVAAQYLKSLGYRKVIANWTCRVGEIDLIFADGDELVLVEVKTRADDRIRPELQVGPAKRAKLRRLAKAYLRRHPWPGPVRFDVVAVIMPSDSPPTVRHHPRAFTA